MPLLNILLLEDAPDDVLFLTRAFQRAAPGVQFITLHDGQEAYDYLTRNQTNLPGFAIIDVKAPRASGLDVLAFIRASSTLKHMRVVILTSSQEPQDVRRAQTLGIDAYLQKPLSHEDLVRIARDVVALWNLAP